MFKGHPKGLFVLAITNMGERFGYYTMLAIFLLFLQAKFGFSASTASTIYSTFLACVYFLPLIGGIIADKFLGYGKTIMTGICIMFCGYLLLAIPSGVDFYAKAMMFGALFLISLGTGFFKGNLQALVGNLYDDPQYSKNRDLAFSIFYMCINIGAFFAPSAAEAVCNFFLSKSGLFYNAQIPALAHQFLNNTITPEGLTTLQNIAEAQIAGASANLSQFSEMYISKLSESYNYGFAVACVSLIISISVFIFFRKQYKSADITETQKAKDKTRQAEVVELTKEQTRERLIALGLVFLVVIFFWMSFHQNGLTMTFFARDYTANKASGLGRIWFSLLTLVPIIIAFYGFLSAFQQKGNKKIIGLTIGVAGICLAYLAYSSFDCILNITPQKFQQFNPFFIILLTPVIVGFFGWLNNRGKEPSAPRKIGYGMIVAALGFIVLSIGSIGLSTPDELAATGGVSPELVTPNLLIGTYFVLTIAELFLSPMGISFVSRVAPPKYKGLMQGGWLAATAIGNYATVIIGYLWGGISLWILWGILVTCCILSAIFIFSVMNRLEKATK